MADSFGDITKLVDNGLGIVSEVVLHCVSVISLKILKFFKIFFIHLFELRPLLLSLSHKLVSHFLNVLMDSEVNDKFIRLWLLGTISDGSICDGFLKHSTHVVVSFLEFVETGNSVITDQVSHGNAVDLDAVRDRVEQVLSSFLVSLLDLSGEGVKIVRVLLPECFEVFIDSLTELLSSSLVITFHILNLSLTHEVEGDFDGGVD